MKKQLHLFTTVLATLTLLLWGNVGLGQTEILLNGDFSSWDDNNTPTSWNHIENVTQEATIYHSAPYSAKHVGGTSDLGQSVAVTAGETYTISLWYYVETGDGTDARIWAYWKSGGTNLPDNADELRGPNGSYFTSDPSWQEYTVTLVAPDTADEFYFEVRTYSSATAYYDDFSVIHESSSDTNPPVPTFAPADAATDVPIDVNPTITFNEPIYTSPAGVVVDNSNVTDLITFTDGVDPVAFTATIAGNAITVVPTAELLNDQAYTLTVGVVQDEAGNAMAAPASATFTTISETSGGEQTTINFDVEENWIQDGTIGLGSYANHGYAESGATFQGTNVLRNGVAAQDGFSGALGTYSFRVRNTADAKILIAVAAGGIADFSFKVRRWDGSPMPDYTVKYSANGTDWTSLPNINGDLLATSDWFTYSETINQEAGNILIEIQNTGTTERIMIDDFAWTGYTAGPDTDPPVPTFFPLDAATDVPIDVNPTITFDEPIYTSPAGVVVDNTNVADLITLTDGTDPVAFTATIAENVITVTPAADLAYETAHTLTVAAVQDEATNAMDAAASATFTTISATAPVITLTSAHVGETYYGGQGVTVTWTSENVTTLNLEVWLPIDNMWQTIESGLNAADGSVIATPPADIGYATTYKLRLKDVDSETYSNESGEYTMIPVLPITEIQSNADLDGNSNYVDDVVKTGGIISAVTSTSNFFLQAGVGAYTGINVNHTDHSLALGDSITIVAKVKEHYGMTQLYDALEITNHSNEPLWAAATIATGDLGEMYESVLVTVENAEVISANQYGELTINDGSGDAMADDAIYGYDIPEVGRIIGSLTGAVEYSYSNFKILPRSINDFYLLGNDATLAALTLGGMDALGLTGIVVTDPENDTGATMFVDDFTSFAGIVATPTDPAATVEVKLNNGVVAEGDLAAQALADGDVVVVTVTAEDSTEAHYKVTLTGENRELTLTAPTGVNAYSTGDDIVFTWTSANIDNVNLYVVDAEEVYLINEEGPITATTGTYTYTVANGDFGTYKFRIADASDATFYDQTTESSTITDTQAPDPIYSYPLIDEVDMPTSFTLLVEFDEDVQLATGSLTIHKLSDNTVVQTLDETDGTVVDNVVSGDIAGLDWNTEYYINITAGMIQDLAGNPLPAITDQSWAFTTMAELDTDLFFSEYIEGSSNNKALEIYNPTAQTISLDSYRIAQAVNGGGWAHYHTFPEGATLAPEDVWVIITDEVDSDLFAAADADEVLGYPSVVHYNGNDARGLEKTTNGTDWVLIDIFGDPNSDADFDVAGVTGAAANHTLVRKTAVVVGNTDWAASAGTNAEDSEWIVHPINTFSFLGWHGKSDEAEILTFEVDAQMAPSTIDTDAATIALEVLYGTDLTALTPTFTLSLGATATIGTVEQEPGVTVVDFTNPVVYTVEAESGVTKDWTVTITEAAESTEAEIVSFSLAEQMGPATIDSEAATVEITVASDADVTALVPTITVSLGATISPESGVAQNFTAPVEYTVTAQDGTTTKDWTVTVTAAGIIPIYDIQYTEAEPYDSPYEGQVVTTTGIVTAHHYNYEGGSFKGFFIQDGEGAWNGLYVFNEVLAEADRPNVGDEIVVSGLVKEFYNLTQLAASSEVAMSIEVVSTGNDLPAPTVLTTAQAAEEPWEGVLIQVKNAEYTIEADNYNVLGVNDGSGDVYVDDDMYDYMAAEVFTLNQSYNITGIGYYSYSNAKILPRFAADITPYTSVTTIWGESINAYPNPFTSTLYVDNVENASRVTIINLIGQQVMSVNLTNTNRAEISTSNLPSGVYLVTIVNNQGQKAVRKMIKR
ncbi:MAG: Ig-like domain-containing protein [Bacteroidales bacterium]|nr:Ig-like domain-containing protein [Bacteroidales bacterium]MDD4671937.1 Ig-like domain-containing protein [Bacteroidales bacterium]